MSEVTLKKCDVFGTTKDVRRITVNLVADLVALRNHDGEAVTTSLGYDLSADLSPRAVARLLRFIRRGLAAPPPRNSSVGAAELPA